MPLMLDNDFDSDLMDLSDIIVRLPMSAPSPGHLFIRPRNRTVLMGIPKYVRSKVAIEGLEDGQLIDTLDDHSAPLFLKVKSEADTEPVSYRDPTSQLRRVSSKGRLLGHI
jgi:hypothetical protein